MIGFDEAVAIVARAARPIGMESVDLDGAAERTLAEPVIARIDSPVADSSAMDGYAVRDADVTPDARLNLVGESRPGTGFAGVVGHGEAVRIFTGAPLPAGADRVVVQEIVQRNEGSVAFAEMPGDARHIRRRASDFARGAVLVDAGTTLHPGALVAAAGADITRVTVWRRPRVFIVSTGDELTAAGTAADRPGMIPESISFGIAALAARWGAEVVGRRHLVDDVTTMQAAAAALLDLTDVIVVTGGASVGDRDFSRRIFERHGLEVLFSRIAIKPGKPAWLGRAGSAMVVGLPGNPTSALVTARLLLAPLLAGICGDHPHAALRWHRAALAVAIPACDDRETFIRGCWDGAVVRPLEGQDSASQRDLAGAELLIRRPARSPALAAGDGVDVLALWPR